MDCVPSVRVRDFERQADGHVTYVVEFQATGDARPEKQSAWLITRRFSDFLVFRKALRCAYSTCVIPPLPGKGDFLSPFRQRLSVDSVRSSGRTGLRKLSKLLSLTTSNDTELSSYRCHALQTFLRHLLLHRQLRRDPLFQYFIREEGDWKVHLTDPPYSGKPHVLSDPLISTSDTVTDVHADSSCSLADATPYSNPRYVVNTSLLKNRATALQTAFQHLEADERRLLESCTHVHRLHKNYAEALWQWCRYENGSNSFAQCLQSIGHELDSYSSITDPALEEFDSLVERFHVWENYGHSLTEVHLAYQNLQCDAEKIRTRKLTAKTFSQPTHGAGTSAPTEDDQSPLTSAGRHILSESLHFEGLFERDLISILHAFAYLQFRQAERCFHIWDRIHSQLQHVANELGTGESHSNPS